MSFAPPHVSVVIPVYNAARTVAGCIASVQAQTLTDWECICVNDGSTDNSQAILETLARTDSRIRLIHKPNAGVSSARNLGIDAAQGETLFFLDADDTINPTCLEALYNYRKETNANWCACSTTVYCDGQVRPDLFSKLSSRTGNYTIENENFAKDFDLIETWTSWGKLYDLKWLREIDIRFEQTLIVGEDTFFIYNLLRIAKAVSHLNSCKGYNYVITSTAQNLRKREENKYPFCDMIILDQITTQWNISTPLDRIIAEFYINRLQSHLSYCIKTFKWKNLPFPKHFNLNLWRLTTIRYKVFILWGILFILSFLSNRKTT